MDWKLIVGVMNQIVILECYFEGQDIELTFWSHSGMKMVLVIVSLSGPFES